MTLLATLQREMKPTPESSTNPTSSGLTAVVGPSAPHLTLFTICLLLLLYGYEIFNFSLSIDEEVFSGSTPRTWLRQGRWGLAILTRVLPPLGNIPTISTVLFCAGLGVSACILARMLFRSHAGQWAFAALFVSSPFWPHIAEFNPLSWGVGIGCVLLVVCLLLVLDERRVGHILAVGILAFAISIYQIFFAWFLVLLCIRYLSVMLGTAPAGATDARKRFPWLRGGLVAIGGLVVYAAIEKLLLVIFSLHMGYVESFVHLSEFIRVPAHAIPYTFYRSCELISGTDPIYLGYGFFPTLLPLLGVLIVCESLLRRGALTRSERLLTGAGLVAGFAFALSPLIVAAGLIPARVFITWIPLSAFLGGIALSYRTRFDKLLYGVLAAALFISIWVSVSLFYADHVARQRDEVLSIRIMERVDQMIPNPPPNRIPFVVIAPAPSSRVEGIQRVEIFGTSFWEHGGGDPVRIAAYLRILGIDSLAPGQMADVAPQRALIEGLPVWPAAGSVALVNGIIVIKLGPMPPPLEN